MIVNPSSGTAAARDAAKEAVGSHNGSGLAHPDIRQAAATAQTAAEGAAAAAQTAQATANAAATPAQVDSAIRAAVLNSWEGTY